MTARLRSYMVRAILAGDFDAWSDGEGNLDGVEVTGRVDDDVPHGSGQWGEKFRVVAVNPTRARAKLARAIVTQTAAELVSITDCEVVQ